MSLRNAIAAAAATSLAAAAVLGGVAAAGGAADRGGAVASGFLAKGGIYRGKTSQGAPVRFRVERGRVTKPAYTVYRRGCGVRITFPNARRINRGGRFFFGSESSDFFTGRFVAPGRVRGAAAVDFSGSSCDGSGVREVRFRARRSS